MKKKWTFGFGCESSSKCPPLHRTEMKNLQHYWTESVSNTYIFIFRGYKSPDSLVIIYIVSRDK